MSHAAYVQAAITATNAEARRKQAIARDGWLCDPLTFKVLADECNPHHTECLEVTIENRGVTIQRIGESESKFVRWQDVMQWLETNDAAWTYDTDIKDLHLQIRELLEAKAELELRLEAMQRTATRRAEALGMKVTHR